MGLAGAIFRRMFEIERKSAGGRDLRGDRLSAAHRVAGHNYLGDGIRIIVRFVEVKVI